MEAGRFIANRLRLEKGMTLSAVALSFFIVVISLAISSGFRYELRRELGDISGHVRLLGRDTDLYSGCSPIPAAPSYLNGILSLDGVGSARAAVYRAGIIRQGDDIVGALFKGTDSCGLPPMSVRVPRRLASTLNLEPGAPLQAYFVGEKVKVRRFTVESVYEGWADSDEAPTVLCNISDLRRLNGWDETQASAVEIILEDRFRGTSAMREKAAEIGAVAFSGAVCEDERLVSTAAADIYPTIFSWLGMIDANVLAILVLMIAVAGFNMVSGLLIVLFRNIQTIGTLKTLGMDDEGVAGVFRTLSVRTVLSGMAIGNALALLFCLVEGSTHFLKLNPANYFISFVPVHIDLPALLLLDALALAVILLIVRIPLHFISRIDPAKAVRSE